MTNTQNIQTKKGFTMIELIFVIVIIGILAAVAIPRLAATRDDAKVASCIADVTIFLKDVSTFYTSQGSLSTDMTAMTNVELDQLTAISFNPVTNAVAGQYTYSCDNPGQGATLGTPAVTFTFANTINGDGRSMVVVQANARTTTQGSVDGDLGFLLAEKNIVDVTAGTDHNYTISGIRIRR